LFMALHAVKKPTYRYTVTQADQKFCRKATIEDSVSSAVLHVTEINNIQNLNETLNKKSVESNSPFQPFIIVVGVDIFNLVEFYVSFGKFFYKFNSFIIALDICFKIYQVFGIKYPNESHKVWSFLQYFFYNMKTEFDIIYPCVSNVIEDLNKM